MRFRAVVAFALLTACSDDPAPATTPAGDGGPPPGDDQVFTTDDDCAPGTRPAVGQKTCVAVGTTTCASGFVKDASGWGCAAVIPTDPCTGPTRPALGETACVPVGDCNGAFPPAGAIIVDPALADGAVDATHKKTLADAVSTAAAGATIALVDGSHDAAQLTIEKEITIVGRCPGKAALVPAEGATYGLRFTQAAKLSGFTMNGIDTPVEAFGSFADVEVDDVVFEASRGRAVFAQLAGRASLKHVVVRGTAARSPGDQTVGVLAGSRATITIEESAVLDSTDCAIASADDAKTSVTVKRSVVDNVSSSALRAFEGAHLVFEESVLRRAISTGVLALHKKGGYPEITLTRSVISGTLPATTSSGNELTATLDAAYGSKITLDDSTISDSQGIAVYSAETAKITLTNSVVVRSTKNATISGSGIIATDSGEVVLGSSAIIDSGGVGAAALMAGKLTIDRSLIRNAGGDTSMGLPVGFGLDAESKGVIVATDSAVVDAKELGISTSDAGTQATLEKIVVTRTPAAKPAQYGHAILAAFDSRIDIAHSVVDHFPGVGLFYAQATGIASASLVERNGIGVHVQQGSSLVEADATPDAPGDYELVVVRDVRFVDNTAKTSDGDVPLPKITAAK